MTYVLYCGLMILGILVSDISQKKNTDKPMLFFAVIISIIAGLRGMNVGIDTISYIEKIDMIRSGHFSLAYGFEEGFKYVIFVLLKLFDNTNCIFLIFALITNILIIKRIYDFKNEIDLKYACLIYYVSFYFMTMNVMRQFCAIAIIFYFSRLIVKRKYILFSIIVCLTAIFIHQSAFIGFLYIALEGVQWKYLTKKSKIYLCMGSISIPIIYYVLIEKILKYHHYFLNVKLNIGFMLPWKICLTLFVLLLINDFKIKIYNRNNLNKEEIMDKYKNLSINIYYILGLTISMLGYFYPFMDRIGWYFYIYESIFWGKLVKNKKYGKLIKIIIIIMLMYIFIASLLSKSQGVVPYYFFWER